MPSSTPSTPSYARSTVASKSKMSPSTPKNFNRPSTISGHDRSIQLINQPTIIPANPTKPCPFANIPLEIREIVFEYILPFNLIQLNTYPQNDPARHMTQSVFRVCRAFRLEASYLFYSRRPFVVDIRHLNFSHVMNWIGSLHVHHRLALRRNRNIVLHVSSYDQSLEPVDRSIWEECRYFGNVYSVTGYQEQHRFVSFCRLAKWFLWCAESSYTNIRWRYDLRKWSNWGWLVSNSTSTRRHMWNLLRKDLDGFITFCSSGNYDPQGKIEGKKGMIKNEALNLLMEIDKEYKNLRRTNWKEKTRWEDEVKRRRVRLEQW